MQNVSTTGTVYSHCFVAITTVNADYLLHRKNSGDKHIDVGGPVKYFTLTLEHEEHHKFNRIVAVLLKVDLKCHFSKQKDDCSSS